MLRNTFFRTLREYRLAIILWGLGLFLLTYSTAPTYSALLNGPDREKQLADLQKLTETFAFITGKAYDLNTYGGFITYRVIGLLPAMLSIFTLLAGSNLIRGEEERGALDVLLSTPHSRRSVIVQKWAGLSLGVLVIMVFCWAGTLAGVASSTGVSLDVGAAVLAYLNAGVVALFFGTLALALGQLTTRRQAAGITGGILAATYLINTSADKVPWLEWLRYFSPFYYESLSKPLAPSVGTNWLALAGLGVAVLVLLVGAVGMYVQRDHGGVFRLFPARASKVEVAAKVGPGQDGSGSLRFTNDFWFSLGPTLRNSAIWGGGISLYILIIVGAVNSIRDQLLNLLNSSIYKDLGLAIGPSNENLLGVVLFVSIPIIYAAYAVLQVASWAGEENSGRLELLLSTPVPRWRFLLDRFGVAVLGAGAMVGLSGLVFALATLLFNVPVELGKGVGAFVGLWIMQLVILAAGFGLSAVGARQAAAVTGVLVGLSYLADLLASLFKLPDWVPQLSVFRQYGRPIVEGFKTGPQLFLVALSLVFIALAVLRFRQRDIAR